MCKCGDCRENIEHAYELAKRNSIWRALGDFIRDLNVR
jgi:hypothetical protein